MRSSFLLTLLALASWSSVVANGHKHTTSCSTKTRTKTKTVGSTVTAPPVTVKHTKTRHRSVCHKTDIITDFVTTTTKWDKDKRGEPTDTVTVTHTSTCAPVTKTTTSTTTATTCSTKNHKRFFTYADDLPQPTAAAILQQAEAVGHQMTNAERLRWGLPLLKAISKRGLYQMNKMDKPDTSFPETEFEFEYDPESDHWLEKRNGEIVEDVEERGEKKDKQHHHGGAPKPAASCTPTTTTHYKTITHATTVTPTVTSGTTKVCAKTKTTYTTTTETETVTKHKGKQHHHTKTHTHTHTHTPTEWKKEWHTKTHYTGACKPTGNSR